MTAAARPIITGTCANAPLMRCGRCLGTTYCCYRSPSAGLKGQPSSLADFSEYHHGSGSTGELLELARSRCVFTSGDAGLGKRFEDTRLEILASGAARDALLKELRQAAEGAPEDGLQSFENMRGGLRDVERAAAFLTVTHAATAPEVIAAGTVSVFQGAGEGVN